MDNASTDVILPYTSPAEIGFDYSRAAHLVDVESEWHDGHDEVSESDIRHWCEAMQDPNPLYTDEEYAEKSKYGGIIAPPQMVQTWSLDPMQGALDHFVRNDPPFADDASTQVLAVFDAMGYHGVVATYQVQEYRGILRPGDMLQWRVAARNVSKYDHYTRMGVGRYVDLVYTFANQRLEVVCVSTFRVLKYKPPLDSRRLYQG